MANKPWSGVIPEKYKDKQTGEEKTAWKQAGYSLFMDTQNKKITVYDVRMPGVPIIFKPPLEKDQKGGQQAPPQQSNDPGPGW